MPRKTSTLRTRPENVKAVRREYTAKRVRHIERRIREAEAKAKRS